MTVAIQPGMELAESELSALASSERHLRQLADAMPQIVWAARPDGTLDYYNQRWFEYIDEPPERVAETAWDRYIHPDDLLRAYTAWTQSIGSGESYVIEFRVRRADGAYRWFLVRALPVLDESGGIARWFGTCTDIHDKRLADEAIRLARARMEVVVEDLRASEAKRSALLDSERAARVEAERASHMKDEFLATLSHELRTPLNAILGWTHLIRRGKRAPADLEKGLDVIERNARAQAQIIDDLLDMSRIISGKIRLDVRPLDLASLIHAAIEAQRPAADAKHILLACVLEPLHEVVLSGDASRLTQVLWNLLSNAMKFTPQGGSVQVLLERVGAQLELRVVDSGEGIDAAFLGQVFDRFRQADASITRRHGGLGLGLAIVKQLVELHGGSVRVESPGVGQGATFIVVLPLQSLAIEPAPTTAEATPASLPVGSDATGHEMAAADGFHIELSGLRVLVVDDELDARDLVQRLLAESHAVVVTASTVDEAVRALGEARFDLVVSDVGMPSHDGYSLIRTLRALPVEQGGATPAVALSAYANHEDRSRALRAGFQMHLAKPIEPSELLAVVASLTGRVRKDSP